LAFALACAACEMCVDVWDVIAKFFTNMSFTALMKDQLSESLDWNNPQNVGNGRLIDWGATLFGQA